MASFKFHSNPFSSPVGQRIERATDSNLPSEDWALFIEICDIINETEDGAKDAVKAIRKRLTGKKDYKSIMYTLTLLESCVKNCHHGFHVLVANKDVLEDLAKILGQKGNNNQLPQVLVEKILSLIQSWADAFRNSEDLQRFVHYYDQLKNQGFDFPAQNIDNLAPIHTPKRSIPQPEPQPRPQSANTAQPGAFAPIATQRPVIARTNSGPINPSPTQLGKLRSELNIVEGNVRVMSEMLSSLNPHQEENEDMKLLQELNSTCREMQQRIIALLERVANDEVTGELLRVNDVLNNIFIRYDRFDRNRKGVTSPVSSSDVDVTLGNDGRIQDQTAQAAQNGSNSESLLIDFDASSAAKSTQRSSEDADFDMFAQTRSSTFADSRRNGSTYEDNITNVPTESFAGAISSKAPYPSKENDSTLKKKDADISDDIQDVEEWLKDTDLNKLEATPANTTTAPSEQTNEEDKPATTVITNDEFDQFLAERAFSGPQRISSRSSTGPPRQMQNMAGETSQDQMFAL